MYQASVSSSEAHGGLVRVSTCKDLMFLVKESEIVTGVSGRKFYVHSADRLSYRLHYHPNGYKVQRLDDADNPTCTMYMPFEMFVEHGLGVALSNGQLFTERLFM